MNTERLSGKRHLSNLLGAARLWSKRSRLSQQLGAVAGGDRELEAREQDTDDD